MAVTLGFYEQILPPRSGQSVIRGEIYVSCRALGAEEASAKIQAPPFGCGIGAIGAFGRFIFSMLSGP
jgi:hypothetical protein